MPVEDIAEALRRAGIVEVDVSSRRRAEYSGDASLYRVLPSAVVAPRHTDEVIAALEACRSLGVPLTMRGAGTSIAGNAVGPGVVLDTSRHLTRILHLDAEEGTATVEPGVVLSQLQTAAAPHGWRFGPDPSTHDRCTLGGMIGNDACGSRALGYGRTSDNVRAVDVVLGTGERLHLGPGVPRPAGSPGLDGLDEVVAARLAPIRQHLGRFSRQVSGYALHHLLPENGRDAGRALVGSEGTLALTLGATVNLVRRPDAVTLVALGYASMPDAADAVPVILSGAGAGLTAMEGLDSRLVEVVRQTRGSAAVPELPRGSGWLLVEVTARDKAELRARAQGVVRASGALDSRDLGNPSSGAGLAVWRIREAGAGLAARPTATRRAHAGWEDCAVPPQRLGAYLRAFEELLSSHGLSGLPYGHFGEGCVHVRINFPLGVAGHDGGLDDHGTAAFRSFLYDAADLVVSFGGSLSGEHGDGRARSELLARMYPPEILEAFRAVKGVLDPDGILNPGVLVDPAPVDRDLRLVGVTPVSGMSLRYDEDAQDFARAVHRCTGVGACRADRTGAGAVMCPSFLATNDEKDTTRGRSRVLGELARGSYGPPTPGSPAWRSADVQEALDLCLQCKGCSSDCPTGVDMAAYKSEVLHQAYAGRVRPAFHYAMGALPRWARVASRTPRLANALLRSPLAAPGKRLVGIDARRSLPPFVRQTFRAWFADHQPADGDPVLLWVDTFTDLFSPGVGKAAVAVLESSGFSVAIPAAPVCCGLTWLTTGQIDIARAHLKESVTAIAAAAGADVPVVGLEPSCVGVFRGDAERLLDSHDEIRTAARVRTLAETLLDREGWVPPDLSAVTGVAQPHCHHHAVMGWSADQQLLRAGGAEVMPVGGCCGFAGSFGVQAGHYEMSVAVAETALLPAVTEATERLGERASVLADGFSCRAQLDDLAGVRGKHLAEVLHEATHSAEPGTEEVERRCES